MTVKFEEIDDLHRATALHSLLYGLGRELVLLELFDAPLREPGTEPTKETSFIEAFEALSR
ncbi:hypothetical protein HPP92_026219 [Vanilla planifolia]|uniref:Uncharacterized protein n=1 Tax=Vanilla planifolia TaxID=51239 RepID=A0A835PGC3_VANPL|nr:hypothetical protein HPP92_026219 [Vanilla planifolia]